MIFEGLRVIDCSSFIAAPGAATVLSDFGADVIKIEPPGAGDAGHNLSRLPGNPKTDQSYGWLLDNRNKRGMVIDLARPDGQAVLHRLTSQAGVEGPFKIGLNEVAIGMAMHDVGHALSRYRLHRSMFDRSVITAEMFDPAGALGAGFLDELTSPDALMATARSAAERLKKLDMTAHLNTKLKARKALLEDLDSGIQSDKKRRLSSS